MTRKLMLDGKAVEVESDFWASTCVIRYSVNGKEVKKDTFKLENAIILMRALQEEIEKGLQEYKGEIVHRTAQ